MGKLLEKRDDLVYKGVETEQVENVQELIDSLCINYIVDYSFLSSRVS